MRYVPGRKLVIPVVVVAVLCGATVTAYGPPPVGATAPGQPTVSLSTTAAGASGVTYTIGFTTSGTGSVPVGGSLTLIGPAGTVWPHADSAYGLTDSTTPSGSFTSVTSISFASPGLPIYNWLDGNRGAAVTVTVPDAITAADQVTLSVTGVVNPGAGSRTLAVATSADTSAAASTPYVITAEGAVSPPSVSLSAPAAAESGVTYSIGFTTSGTGAIPAGGSITLVGPAGTVWPHNGSDYQLTDARRPRPGASAPPRA